MEQVRQKYQDRDVAIVSLYVREPHPHETGFKQYEQPATIDKKMEYARELVDLKDMNIPVAVDSIDQAQHIALGNLPNMAYVVDKGGIVQYANNWLLADDIDATLARLVTEDDPSNPTEPSVFTASLDSSI